MPSLLVTNDFPPKIGGIQSYLYELWRRLPPDETTVFTTPYAGTKEWDAEQTFRVVRAKQKVLLPSKRLARDVDALAREVNADVIFLDPMLPLGLIGPRLTAAPYVVIAHGAEITVPASVPGVRALGRKVLRRRGGGRRRGRLSRAPSHAYRGPRPQGRDHPARRRRDALPSGRRRNRARTRASATGSIPTVRSCSGCRASFPAKASTS